MSGKMLILRLFVSETKRKETEESWGDGQGAFSLHPLLGTWREISTRARSRARLQGRSALGFVPCKVSPIPCGLLLSDGQAGQPDAITATWAFCCAARAYHEFGLKGWKAARLLRL